MNLRVRVGITLGHKIKLEKFEICKQVKFQLDAITR